MSETARRLDDLHSASGRLGAVFARPKVIAGACVVALAVLGWLSLALMTQVVQAPGLLPRAIAALCQVTPQAGAAAALLTFSMWAAMVLAMMLPSAAPMIFTYAEIGETAARKGERIVSPLWLTSGYAAVWLGFACAATLVQILFLQSGWLGGPIAAGSSLFAGALFVVAGLYQFTSLKHACLTQCQRPFPFFFAQWQTTAPGVFRLGLKQGLYCLGCCWAMMALMFVSGTMNIIWMAALGAAMTIEKMLTGRRFSYVLGTALTAAGIAVVGSAVVAHWPARAV